MPFRPITDLILVSPLIELREVLAFGSCSLSDRQCSLSDQSDLPRPRSPVISLPETFLELPNPSASVAPSEGPSSHVERLIGTKRVLEQPF